MVVGNHADIISIRPSLRRRKASLSSASGFPFPRRSDSFPSAPGFPIVGVRLPYCSASGFSSALGFFFVGVRLPYRGRGPSVGVRLPYRRRQSFRQRQVSFSSASGIPFVDVKLPFRRRPASFLSAMASLSSRRSHSSLLVSLKGLPIGGMRIPFRWLSNF